jgi:hypothetical protein
MGRPKKYSDKQKAEYRAEYEKSRGGNLTRFGAMIGDQFRYRVNLLAQILRDAHEYSLGRYKERLLSQLISESLPSRYAVGTGFVLFPKERTFTGSPPSDFDALNRSDHEVSRQCDIIVYDKYDYPAVLQDGDFVVVLPEATRAIIEVKGTLKSSEIDNSVGHLIDFGLKWQQCDRFYRSKHSPYLHEPSLFILAWQIGANTDGTPQSDAKRFQEAIVSHYKKIQSTDFEGFPYLDAALLYNDAVISSTIWFEKDEFSLGFVRCAGKLHYYDGDGKPVEAGDGTISELISRILVSLDTPFNRFVSYKSEARSESWKESSKTYSVWLEGAAFDSFKWAERRGGFVSPR